MDAGQVSRPALQAEAGRLGFAAAGIASLEPSRYADALDRWLAAGYAGTMRYLHRQARRRKAPATIVPEARVAVVVLENYLPEEPGNRESEPAGPAKVRIAKYARGTDYHRALKARLEELAGWLRSRGAAVTRSYTDAGPVPERELAARAGLGWIGKNTMLIRPGAGSFFLIGSIFTDLEFGIPGPESGASPSPSGLPTPDSDYCGSCTRCLDACPTGALLGDRVLDATRCISYLTIESRAPIPEPRAGELQGWAFGCDICNDVCPWNQRFAAPTARPEYRERGAIRSEDPGFFDRMSPEEFAARFGDTPLERPGLVGMRRNWRVAWRSLSLERR